MRTTLKNLFLSGLGDMYDSEHRLIRGLPKLIKAANCEKLQQVLQHHLEETEEQASKIDRVFGAFDEKPRIKRCPAMAGILEEGDRIVIENRKSSAINAATLA
jgi:ferritin-like metal-binding protein YciE